jgi:hypothetical protein
MSQISTTGLKLTPRAAARTAAAVRLVLNNRGGSSDQQPDVPMVYQPFWAQLNGESTTIPGNYSWTAQQQIGGQFSNGRISDTNFTAIEANLTGGLSKGTVVKLEWAGRNASNPTYNFCGPGQLRIVNVTMDGGTLGSDSTTCNATYTVTALNGASMKDGTSPTATGKIPLWNRASLTLPNVTYTEAASTDPCMAMYDGSGNLVLLYVTETPGAEECSTSSGGSSE